MNNPKWGTKRLCLSCGNRFYDMQRDLIICPGCDTTFELGAPTRTRKSRAPAKSKTAAPPPEASAVDENGAAATEESTELEVLKEETADDEVEVEEQSAETIEDPSELGEDKDDMAEVIESIEEPEKTDM